MNSAILLPVIIIVVIGAVIAVFAVTGVNPFERAKGGVVETAFSKLLDTKTFKLEGKAEINVEAGEGGFSAEETGGMLPGVSSVKMFLNVSGGIDRQKRNNLKTSSQLTLGVDAEGMQIAAVIEIISIDSDVFIKVVSLPTILAPFLGGATDIQNQWIKIDLEALMEKQSEYGAELDKEQLKERFAQLVDELGGLLEGKTLFDMKEKVGPEEISGIAVEHYSVEANKEAVKQFILDYVELSKKYVAENQKAEYERTVQETMKDFPENFEQFWTATGGIALDVWIEQTRGRLVKVKWEKVLEPSQIENMSEDIESMSVKSEFVFSDFNQKQNIEAPSVSKPFEEIFSSLMSQFMPQGLPTSSLPSLP